MKKLVLSIAFAVLTFAGFSQNGSASKNSTEPVESALLQPAGNAEVQGNESALINKSVGSNDAGSLLNSDSRVEKSNDVKANEQKSKNIKGRRRGSQNTWVYIAIGVVAAAVILYFVGSAGVSKS